MRAIKDQITTVALLLLNISSFGQDVTAINLHDAFKKGRIEVYNRELDLFDEPAHNGIRLSKAYGEGVAWIKDIAFSNGEIEFDVRGEDVKGHSFVGIAFHGANDSTFDAVYLRPFRFKEAADSLRSHSTQYISLPAYTWRVLRKESPGVYEHTIDPSPDPNAWVHMRVVVQGETVSTYIDGAMEPSLVVKKVTKLHTGRIGFYVADTSGGDFANIRITRTK